MPIINIKQMQEIETAMLKETVDILQKNDIVFYLGFGSVLGAVRHGGPIPWDADVDILVPVSMMEKARICLEEGLSSRFMVHGLHNDKRYNLVFPRVALSPETSFFLHVDIFPILGFPEDADKQQALSRRLDKCADRLINKQFRKYIRHMSPIKNIIGKAIEIFCSPLSCRALGKRYYAMTKKYDYNSAETVYTGGGCYGTRNIMDKSIYGTPVWVDYCGFQAPIPEKWDAYLKQYYKDYMKFPPEEEQTKGLSITYNASDADYEKIKEITENEPQ